MEVDVVRSPRRRKTVQARVVDGRLRVMIPASMSGAEEEHWVEVMRHRMRRKHSSDGVDLRVRAQRLARSLALPEPASITWSERQRTLWGSCSVEEGRVRISTRLVDVPPWVLDYVIVHELAHLLHDAHDAAFWEVVGRYRFAERARGYLIAKGEMGPTGEADRL